MELLYQSLINQLKDEDPGVRTYACWALGQLRFKVAARQVAALLGHDDDITVRCAAAEAIGFMGEGDCVHALVGALEDPERLIRTRAVESLGRLGDKRCADALKHAMGRDENEPIRAYIIRVLNAITGVTHRYLTPTEKKIEKYRKQVEENPASAYAHYNLAVAYYYNEQYDLALYHCEVAKRYEAGVKWLEQKLSALPPELLEPQGPRAKGLRGETVDRGGGGAGRSHGEEGEPVFDSGEVPTGDFDDGLVDRDDDGRE